MAEIPSRLEARIPSELHALVKHAASVQGVSLTDFVISAVRAEAERTIERHTVMQLSLRDQLALASALTDTEGKPTPAMRNVKRHHEEMIAHV